MNTCLSTSCLSQCLSVACAFVSICPSSCLTSWLAGLLSYLSTCLASIYASRSPCPNVPKERVASQVSSSLPTLPAPPTALSPPATTRRAQPPPTTTTTTPISWSRVQPHVRMFSKTDSYKFTFK